MAELANVSAMTVTRTFNGSGPVAEKTRAKILKVASELGYRPNIMAQSLRSGRTNSIGLLWSLGGPHDSIGVVRNISIRLMHKGYACHVADSLSDPEIIKKCLTDFCSRNVDGVIVQLDEKLISNKEIYALLQEISNVIIVSPESIKNGFDSLTVDRTQAIREIINHFALNKRKKIIFLTTKDSGRERAFLEQVKLHGLSCDDNYIIYLDNCYDNEEQNRWDYFVKELKDRFNDKMPFDALICSTDEGAAAVISYLEKIGFRVPEDIAVAGFNNSGMTPYFRPPLASVDRRNQDVAESVVKLLLNRIKHPAGSQQYELLEMKFIHRASAG